MSSDPKIVQSVASFLCIQITLIWKRYKYYSSVVLFDRRLKGEICGRIVGKFGSNIRMMT